MKESLASLLELQTIDSEIDKRLAKRARSLMLCNGPSRSTRTSKALPALTTVRLSAWDWKTMLATRPPRGGARSPGT